MSDENLIHIKLEFEEALQSKKDILSSEINLLKLEKIIKRYHRLRKEELKSKLNLSKRMREIKIDIRKLEQTLPEIKIPKILETRGYEEKDRIIEKSGKTEHDDDIEYQLLEIQRKLNSLQE